MIAEDSVRFAHSGPSHNLLRPAIAELVSCGPLPLPVSGGGHASAIAATPQQHIKTSVLYDRQHPIIIDLSSEMYWHV